MGRLDLGAARKYPPERWTAKRPESSMRRELYRILHARNTRETSAHDVRGARSWDRERRRATMTETSHSLRRILGARREEKGEAGDREQPQEPAYPV